MIIERQSCLRSYACNNLEIKSICIFDESGIIYDSCQGWFEHYNYPDQPYHRQGTRDVIALQLDGLKRKVKLDFKAKHPYWIKQTIYIPASSVSFKPLGEKMVMETKTNKNYLNFFEITVVCRLYSYDFENQDDYGELRERTLVISSRGYRSEKTSFGLLVDEIAKKTDVSCYEVENLLKHYHCIPKSKVFDPDAKIPVAVGDKFIRAGKVNKAVHTVVDIHTTVNLAGETVKKTVVAEHELLGQKIRGEYPVVTVQKGKIAEETEDD